MLFIQANSLYHIDQEKQEYHWVSRRDWDLQSSAFACLKWIEVITTTEFPNGVILAQMLINQTPLQDTAFNFKNISLKGIIRYVSMPYFQYREFHLGMVCLPNTQPFHRFYILHRGGLHKQFLNLWRPSMMDGFQKKQRQNKTKT